jgi:RNA polymerase sigma-70 factor (ECF subfamily)
MAESGPSQPPNAMVVAEPAVAAPGPLGSGVRVTERQTFRQIFEEHAAAVGRILRVMGVAEADVMDAAQEVFLVVNRRYGEFEGRSTVSTWIRQICIRVALSSRRSRRRRREDVLAEPPEESVAADQQSGLEGAEDRRLLGWLLDSLDVGQREVIVLHDIEHLPMREVAEIIGVPLQTAYSRRKSALANMRDRLGRWKESR